MEPDSYKLSCILCVFCCRQISNRDNIDLLLLHPKDRKNNKPSFIELLQRCVGAKNDWQRVFQTLNNESLQLESCQDCYTVVNSFCKLYHELKCLELQLQWKIQTLMRIMKTANRVPSRVKTIKEMFAKNEDSTSGKTKYECFMETRQQIVMKCFEKQEQTFPRVFLRRLDLPVKTQTLLNSNTYAKNENDINCFEKSLVDWFISFTAIMMLLMPSSTSLETLSNEYEDFTIDVDCELMKNGNTNLDTPTATVPEESQVNVDSVLLPCATNSSQKDTPTMEMLPRFKSVNNEHEDSSLNASSSTNYNGNHAEICNPNSDIDAQACLAETDDEAENTERSVADIKREIILETQEISETDITTMEFSSKPEISTSRQENELLNKSEFIFRCQYCQKRFRKQQGLSNHITIKHLKHVRPFFCKLCNRGYSKYAGYLLHRKTLLHLQKLKLQNNIKQETVRDDIIISKNKTEQRRKSNKRKHKLDSESESLSSEDEIDKPGINYNLRSREPLERNRKGVPDQESYSTGSDNETSNSEETSSETSDESNENSNSEISSETSDEETLQERKPRAPNPKRKRKKWYCFKEGCNYCIPTESGYQAHQKLHEPGKYKCMFCEVVEVNALKLSIHEERKHCKEKMKPGMYYCPRCPYSSQHKRRYINHFAQFHLGVVSSESCSICKVHISKGQKKMHFQRTHDTSKIDADRIIKCPMDNCKAYFTNNYGFFRHRHDVHVSELLDRARDQETVDGKYMCYLCNIHFLTKRELTRHRRLYHKQTQPSLPTNTNSLITTRKFICPTLDCSQKFRENESLQTHQKLHGNFACNFCNLTFDYAPDLSNHELVHVESDADRYKCPRCVFQTNTWHKPRYITHHLEVHMGLTDQVIPCHICDQRFRHYDLLQKHITGFHTQNQSKKIRACTKCPAYFLKEIQLWRHQISRHGYIYCQEENCTGQFKEIKEFKEHYKLHGSFNCQFCEMVKEYAPDLSIHEILEQNTHDAHSSQTIKCSRCAFTSMEQSDVVTHHLEAHLKLSDKGFLCTVCGKRLKSWNLRYVHYQNAHKIWTKKEVKLHHCNHCTAYFINKLQLLKHQQSQHFEYYTCSARNCKAVFESTRQLEDHKTWHGEFKCKFCDICMDYAPDLASHELEKHCLQDNHSKTYKCSRCPYSITQKGRCVHHFMEVHLNISIKTLHCPECDYSTSSKRGIVKHVRKVHRASRDPSNIHTCNQCTASFTNATHLILHTRKVHQRGANDQFYCKICNKSYKGKKTFRVHLRKNHDGGYGEFVCSFPNCKKRFETKEDLKLHEIHAKSCHVPKTPKTETCKKCGRLCKGDRALKNHMKVHREGRQTEFKCGQCDKTFKQKRELRTHEMFHKGPDHWEFLCAFCPKRCTNKYKLEEHTRTHTKEKPFVCQVCGEYYAHRHNLQNHLKSKHKDECDVDRDFSKKSKMRFYVSRKGKKLGREFCFTREQDQARN